MYINFLFADIKIVLSVVLIIVAILIFPIFTNIKVYYSKKNVLSHRVYLFNVLPILKGEIQIIKEGIVIHLTKRKAVIFEYKDFISLRKKFEPIKDFHLLNISSKLKIGISGESADSIKISTIYMLVMNWLEYAVRKYKPYVEFDNRIYIYEDNNFIKFKGNITFVFNLLIVVISVIKILIEKVFYALKYRTE